jgi:hypothetical protein
MEIIQPGGHLDQMIRETRAHQVQLSSMADVKANMMLTVASLMIPLVSGFLDDPRYAKGALIMIGFCALTVMLAAYAAMPKVSFGRQRKNAPDVKSPFFNILFFGSFVQLNYEVYLKEMEEMMNDPSRTYEAQLREIYTSGQYLSDKKFRYIRLAYMSFIAGICTSALVIGAGFILHFIGSRGA